MTSVLLLVLLLPFSGPILTVPVVEAAAFATDAQFAWVHHLEDCESGGVATTTVIDTNNKYSRGILQFQMATWLHYGKDFGATSKNIYDPDLQEHVAITMLNNGGEGNWYNCNNSISKKYGPYPKEMPTY